MFVLFAGFLLTGAGGGGFLYAITKEAKFSEKVPELIKGLGVSNGYELRDSGLYSRNRSIAHDVTAPVTMHLEDKLAIYA
jgi:hypothetical protein